MNLGVEYIKFRWKSLFQKPIHSSFVQDLRNLKLRNKITKDDARILTNMISSLNSNDSIIHISDFGAGSKKLGSKRTISSILKTSSSKGKYGKMLYYLSKKYQPKRILEFGTSLGVGTTLLKLGYQNSEITTIEACPETFKAANDNFSKFNLEVNSINQTFEEFLKRNNNMKFDMVFIDGHHDGQALMNYLESLTPLTHNETIFILDDIRWSKDMFMAWQTIGSSEQYGITLDLFRMGIVIKSPHQSKEHHVISI